MQKIRFKQAQQNQQRHNGCQQHQRRTNIERHVILIILQQPKVAQNLHLIGAHALAFADDILPLQIHHRFHRVPRFLPCQLGGFLFHHHVGTHAGPQHNGDNVLEQRRFHLVAHNLQNGLNGLIDLPFANGCVERVFHRCGHGGNHHIKIRRAGAQQRCQLIIGGR